MYYDPTLCGVQIGCDDTKCSRYLYREIEKIVHFKQRRTAKTSKLSVFCKIPEYLEKLPIWSKVMFKPDFQVQKALNHS